MHVIRLAWQTRQVLEMQTQLQVEEVGLPMVTAGCCIPIFYMRHQCALFQNGVWQHYK